MSDQLRAHADYQLDVAEYAFGSLDAPDRDTLEDHLRICEECRDLLAEYQQVVGLYALTAPREQPPEGAFDRLLERARIQTPAPPLAAPRNMRLLWTGFAALAALLLLMLGWNLWLQFDAEEGNLVDSAKIAIVIPMSGSEDAAAASGHLVMDAAWDECALVASGLPALNAERDYQLWFVRADGTRVSGAVFHSDDSGKITVQVEVPAYWRDIERVGVTEEPTGGSPEPTGHNILLGQFARSP